jgi:hypothetical protein
MNPTVTIDKMRSKEDNTQKTKLKTRMRRAHSVEYIHKGKRVELKMLEQIKNIKK